MASAIVTTAARVKPGDLRNTRRANRTSCMRVFLVGLAASAQLLRTRPTHAYITSRSNSKATLAVMQLYEKNHIAKISAVLRECQCPVFTRLCPFMNTAAQGFTGAPTYVPRPPR